MTSHDNPPKTALGPGSGVAGRGIQPRFGDLVDGCRKLVMNRLAEHFTGVFAQIDDTLFDCAEKAENNQVQTLFFDSMREIRKLRPMIERSYHQQIAANFTEFFAGQRKPTDDDPDAEQLSLVRNEDYEESLLVTNMVSKVRSRCASQLFSLDQRLALLNGGYKLAEIDNPFDPQAIAQAFRTALEPCPFVLRIKTILYMLFEEHVMQGLDDLYEALNQRLIDAGVLPNLKFTAQRAADTQRRPAPTPEKTTPSHAAQKGDKPASTGRGSSDADAVALFQGLSELLVEYRQQTPEAPLLGGTRSIASFSPITATSTFSADELLAALDRLQQQSAMEMSQRIRQPQQVDQLKADLHGQLEGHSRKPGQQKLSEQEADVIDLVGMLFDFILDDDNLPDSCKTVLSHLHTPYLKVALQDKALFTEHHHPARRLLNSMAQAGVLYGGDGEDSGLLAKMQWVVEQVIRKYNGGLELFDSLLAEFTEYATSLKHKVELRERRAVEAAKGRDRLLDARQQAVEVINGVLNERDLPAIIRNFLELTWADVLVFVLLRHDRCSSEWQRACEVAELLAWGSTPLDPAGQERLQSIRLEMLEDVRKGLQLLGGYHEDGIRRRLQDIVACQHAVQENQLKVAASLRAKPPESQLGAMLGEDAHLLNSPRESGLSAQGKTLVKKLASLEFGTWFEFREGDSLRQLKLSWFSPTTRNYMFVDHSGQRVAIKPVTLLATEMEQGLARIVSTERGEPLVDRAMQAIVRWLNRLSGRTKESS
jgi:hypothetical protein